MNDRLSVSRRRLLTRGALWTTLGMGGIAGLLPTVAHAEVDPNLQQQIDTLFLLRDGEDVKAVRPPFPTTRMAYYQAAEPEQAQAIPSGPTAMIFRWRDGKAQRWGSHFGGTGLKIPSLARMLVEIYPEEIEGDAELLGKELPGDFIVREGAKPEAVVRQLSTILRDQYRLPVKLDLRNVERKVQVARGTFRHQPVQGRERNRIELYAKELTEPNRGGGGSGNLKECLAWVGMFSKRRVVSEVPDAEQVEVSWHNNEVLRSEAERAANREAEGVLRHFTEQTGITFREEPRQVRVLLVERE